MNMQSKYKILICPRHARATVRRYDDLQTAFEVYSALAETGDPVFLFVRLPEGHKSKTPYELAISANL